MSGVCQSEKQHLDLSIVKLLLLALRHPDCKQNTEIDCACVLPMPANAAPARGTLDVTQLFPEIEPVMCTLQEQALPTHRQRGTAITHSTGP